MAVTVRIHSVIPVKERVLDVLFQVQSPDFFGNRITIGRWSRNRVGKYLKWKNPPGPKKGKQVQLMAEKTPRGVILKSFDLDTYPVLTAVAVRTHSVIPVKERVSVLSSQAQSPDLIRQWYSYLPLELKQGSAMLADGRILLGRGRGRPSN